MRFYVFTPKEKKSKETQIKTLRPNNTLGLHLLLNPLDENFERNCSELYSKCEINLIIVCSCACEFRRKIPSEYFCQTPEETKIMTTSLNGLCKYEPW